MLVLSIIICTILLFVIILNYKKCKMLIKIMMIILFLLLLFVPMILYYLDFNNIPSSYDLTNNVESQNWLAFLANYTSSIISAIIGATVSMYLVIFQIQKNNEDSEKRDKENFRLNNMPILKYEFDTEEEVPIELENLIETHIEGCKNYYLTIGIKNIGLNNIKSFKVAIKINELGIQENTIGYDSLEVLEKGKEIFIKKFFALEGNDKKYNFEIIVIYEDLLGNLYRQIINIEYISTNYFFNGNYVGTVKAIINKEERLIEHDKIN